MFRIKHKDKIVYSQQAGLIDNIVGAYTKKPAICHTIFSPLTNRIQYIQTTINR